MSTRRLNLAIAAVAAVGLVLGATVAEAIAGPTAPPAPGGALGATWEAWRAGWLAIPVTLGVYAGGRALLDQRRWFARRWPRAASYLDRGRVWALLSGVVSIAGALLPAAITGDVTGAAVSAQVAAAVALYVHSTRQAVAS